ncbi:haloacid dehalogenase-like hydrolase [bacterium]|nr:haloacid dehalogenase-like hydrolase [bacterium]
MPIIPTKTAIVFDLDGTIVCQNTQFSLFFYLLRRGKIPLGFFLKAAFWFVLYKLKALTLSGIMNRIYQFIQGDTPENFKRLLREFYRDSVRKKIYLRPLQLIKECEKAGTPVCLISASIQPLVEIVGDYLKVDFAIGTKLEVANGKFTGKIEGEPMYGAIKLQAIRKLAQNNGWDLGSSYFFSDNQSDAPLLGAVGFPRVINPTLQLRKIARQNHWLILYW